MLIWELLEEGLETLIAFAISSVCAIFVVKALSTLGVVVATQGIKVAIKRFLVPFIKKLTYKKGNDKVEKVKKFFSWVWSNKKTLLGSLLAVVSGVITGIAINADFIQLFPALTLLGVNWTAVFIGFCAFAGIELGVLGKGFETVDQHEKRMAVLKAQKEEKAIEKQAKKEIKAEEKLANQTQADKEKAKEKEIADAERKAKVEAVKAKLIAEQNQNKVE